MTDTWRSKESEILDGLARRYVAQGYVIEKDVHLAGSKLVGDLVARRADETVLVEVRPSNRSTQASLKSLAEYAERQGWRFAVVLANEGPPTEIELPSRERVRQLIADARKIDPTSWIALLATTAALEAGARYALARTQRQSVPRATSLGHVQALASQGLITPADEEVLRQLVAARNAAAHGLSAMPVSSDVVAKALDLAAALIEDGAALDG